jgi:hypothetical protein
MSSRRYWIVAGLALVAALALTRPALADPAHGQGNAAEVKARGLFAEGRYADALDIYVRLYADKPHPTYLRNIGRCYQNLEQPDKAISSFREYLRQAKQISADQREQVEGYIREMEDLKKRQREAASARAPAPREAADARPAGARHEADAEERAPARPTHRPSETLSARHPRPEPQESSSGSGARGVAVALGVAGVVGLGVGTYFGLDARSKWSDANSQCPMPSAGCNVGARQTGQSADRSATFSTIGFAAGGVLLTGGVVLWLLSRGGDSSSEAHASVDLRFIPQVGAGLAAGTIAGTF